MKKTRRLEVLSQNGTEGKTIEEIIAIVLANRNVTTKEDREAFLHPSLATVNPKDVGITTTEIKKTVTRLQQAIEKKEKIVVFGDYDVDGITGTAILWETLYEKRAEVIPYIPHRVDEGYGLSIKGIENVLKEHTDTKIIITVDNGIVANEAVSFANKKGIEVIITDHHTKGEKDPDAFAIVHTTNLCGATVAWLLSKELKGKSDLTHLDLVSLATVADLVPLTGANRSVLKNGLPFLQKTSRVGLQALFFEAGIDPRNIGVYEIGHIIAPRLNAMGRLESAMDSLRLLCTRDKNRAQTLATQLGTTNRERQLLTQAASMHAIEQFNTHTKLKNLLFIASESYEEGIIGLVAGKLVEAYYRPAIVLSKGEKISKASARSVSGFNIIDFIRGSSGFLLNAGGHPMAAGFTIETEKIVAFQKALETLAEQILTEEHLTPVLKIDCELALSAISQKLYESLQQLSPFGMGNPEPTFLTKGVTIEDKKVIGQTRKHLKLKVRQENSPIFEAIAFNMAEKFSQLKPNTKIQIAYTVDENEWNRIKTLQLKIKELIV